jgi:hypothetical protein
MHNPHMPCIRRINTHSRKQVLRVLSKGFYDGLHGFEVCGLVGGRNEGVHGIYHPGGGGGDYGYIGGVCHFLIGLGVGLSCFDSVLIVYDGKDLSLWKVTICFAFQSTLRLLL